MAPFIAQDPNFEAAVRRSLARISLMRTVGALLGSVAPGQVDVVLPFREELAQHHGLMAAPALTAIADVACGYAAMSRMPPGGVRPDR